MTSKFFLLFAGAMLWRTAPAQDTTYLSLLFLGDIMQHDSQRKAAYIPDNENYDYSQCFRWIAPHLQAADVTIGNLEVTLAGEPYAGYPRFSAPDALARDLKRAGVDVLVTANNHSLDRGRPGLERTLEVLRAHQLLATGTFKDSAERATQYPLQIEQKGFRLSLLNYTYGTNGIPVTAPNIVNLIDTVQIVKDMNAARSQQSDIIIVFFHWGSEYQSQPTAWQKALARLCFREGAQLVVGAHPHVLQPMEWDQSKNHVVAYSLGNFVSGQRPRYRDGGATLRVVLQKISTSKQACTIISAADYHLQWVYRDSRQRYFVLPAAAFETDTVVVQPTQSREALRQFLADSRALFSRYNTQVAEDSLDMFRVWITSDSLLLDHPVIRMYKPSREEKPEVAGWYTVALKDVQTAIRVATEITQTTPYRHAAIVRVPKRRTRQSSPR